MTTRLAWRLMRRTATIARQARVGDGQGGWLTDYVTIATGVACKLDVSARVEEMVGEREREAVRSWLFVPVGTDIARGDRVAIDMLDLLPERVMYVHSVEEPGGIAFSAVGGQIRCAVEAFQPAAATIEGGSS